MNGFMKGAQPLVDQHLSSMAQLEILLAQLIAEQASDPALLGVGDMDVGRQAITKEFPYPGARRALVQRTGEGPNVPAAGSGLIFTANPNRLGGSIVNKTAAQGVTLVLSDQNRIGAPTVWLPPNGGQWNFLLSGLVWCGNVFAVPDSGNLSLSGASI